MLGVGKRIKKKNLTYFYHLLGPRSFLYVKPWSGGQLLHCCQHKSGGLHCRKRGWDFQNQWSQSLSVTWIRKLHPQVCWGSQPSFQHQQKLGDLKHVWDLGGCISKPQCLWALFSWILAQTHSSPGWKGLMDQLPLGLLCDTRQRISAWYSYHTECTNWWSVCALLQKVGN